MMSTLCCAASSMNDEYVATDARFCAVPHDPEPQGETVWCSTYAAR